MCYLFDWKTVTDEMEDEYDLKGKLEVSLQLFTDWHYKRNTYCVKV